MHKYQILVGRGRACPPVSTGVFLESRNAKHARVVVSKIVVANTRP
jgi:hypothetical protein